MARLVYVLVEHSRHRDSNFLPGMPAQGIHLYLCAATAANSMQGGCAATPCHQNFSIPLRFLYRTLIHRIQLRANFHRWRHLIGKDAFRWDCYAWLSPALYHTTSDRAASDISRVTCRQEPRRQEPERQAWSMYRWATCGLPCTGATHCT
jgi:hypothetical protein